MIAAFRAARLLSLFLVALMVGGCGLVRWAGLIAGDEDTGGPTAARKEPPKRGAVPQAAAPPRPVAATPETPPEEPRGSVLADQDGVVDRVVAVVNNDVITLNELRETVLFYKIETKQTGGDDEELARQLLTRLIDARLQLQEADRERIGVEDGELSQELAARMQKVNAGSEQEFEAMIRRQGLTLDVVKKKLREQLMITKIVRRKVAFRVSVTEQEVDRYLADNRDKLETGLSYHARHILIPVAGAAGEDAWAEAKSRAEEVFSRLQAGADFAEVAREVSGDGTAKDGGDLGPLKRGELAEDIEAVILKLSTGEVSQPFRTDLGFHLFKLEASDTLEGEGLARVRQQIREILFRQKYQARLEAWLTEIKQRAIIEIRI